MNVVAFLLIYFSGMPVCYLIFKKNMVDQTGSWTIQDRKVGFIISILSWMVAIVYPMVRLMQQTDDRPAKW